MKTKQNAYTHEQLVQLRQDGVITELDFIGMHPDEQLREDFASFCADRCRMPDDDSARDFLAQGESDLEKGMLRGDA